MSSNQVDGPQAENRLGTVVFRGVAGRCPRCGKGKLFNGVLNFADECDECSLKFFGNDAGDGPAVAAIFILGIVIVALAIWVEFKYLPPLWVHAVLWTPATIVGAVALLRPLRGLTMALQYFYRAVDEDEKLGGQ